jgi:hypothetical protein
MNLRSPGTGLAVRKLLLEGSSIFGIGVDRSHAAKWIFPQEKATFQHN